jgi:type 1 glutamine amidotransferase
MSNQSTNAMKGTSLKSLARALIGLLTTGLVCAATAQAPKKVLVVSVTTGFRHGPAIDSAERVLPKLAQQSGAFTLDFCRQPEGQVQPPKRPTAPKPDADAASQARYRDELAKWEDANVRFKVAENAFQARLKRELEKLSPENLKQYDAVIFNNTTGDLPLPDRQALLDWIRSGKGFLGIHAATDTYHGFKPFIEMIGGEFETHGPQATVDILNDDPNHAAARHLPASWTVHDEIYLVKNYDRSTLRNVLSLDKHPNKRTPGHYPIAWCKRYGQGRVFYTSLGHREDVWEDDTPASFKRLNSPAVAQAFQKHLLNAILWTVGLAPGDATPQTSALPMLEDGFTPLFNGRDLSGWKLRNPGGHNSWSVLPGGVLKNTVASGDHGTDLVTEKKYWNFIVRYDFLVDHGANSGFYLRGRHELQVLDDFRAGKASLSGNGAFYNFRAPDRFVSRPGGQWQSAEVTFIGDKVTVVLNGETIHPNVVCNKATGGELDRDVTQPGPFLLQGDHGTVCFRNLRVKELP